MKAIYPVLFFIIFLITSCQPDSKTAQSENKKTTYANLYLRYLQTEKKVKGEAFFKIGESAQKGKAHEYPKGVFFDGGNMNMKKAVGRKLYRSERNSEFKSSYEFEMNPKGDGAYNYNLKINPIASFKIENGVSKSKGIQLSWEGSNLSKDEELVLLFTDNMNRAFNLNIQGPTNSPTIAVGKEKLTNMKYGKGALYLVRKYKAEQKKDGIQINAVSEFYTNSIEIEVIE